jgi:hypothetical protein
MYQNRKVSINSFLISLSLNLLLLLILSLWTEPRMTAQSKESVSVEFTNPPKKNTVYRRSFIILPKSPQANINPRQASQIATIDTKDFSSPPTASSVLIPETRSFPQSFSPVSSPGVLSLPDRESNTGDRGWGSDSQSRSINSGSGRSIGQGSRGITIRQPKAVISGSGDKLTGYYNISLVKYEDTSDTVSAEALAQLAVAMNIRTDIKTRVIKEPIMLDSPELLNVPMVYITSRRPFAFSERERDNLRKYFNNGGFLLFSNTATPGREAQGVTNSIEFELWKVLGKDVGELNIIGKNKIYKIFFDLPNTMKLRGITLEGRLIFIYEDSGYSNVWMESKNTKDELYKLWVNIIVYALSTSPMVQKN